MIDATELRANIAANVQRLRKDRGLSQEQLAMLIGVSRAQINRIEQAHHTPGADVLYSLADALAVPSDAFRQTALNKIPKAS